MPKKPPAVRRITAASRERLDRLADILYEFLPLTSRSAEAVTFTSIFAESGVAAHLQGATNKRQALQKGLTEVYRRHERLPRMLIRKIVPAAVGYRKHQRRPLKRTEVDELAACLVELGLDMTAELAEVRLDERLPRITVPPAKLKAALREHDLEPELTGDPLELFEGGHFNEAVRKAAERFEDAVHEASGLDTTGRDLMAKAFAIPDLVEIEKFQPENRDSFGEGYRFLAMGLAGAIRNIFSHGDEERRPPEECFEMLLLINWMFRALKRPDTGFGAPNGP